MQNADSVVAVDQQSNIANVDSTTTYEPGIPADDDNKMLHQGPPEPKFVKTIKKIEYELHCTQHNPVRSFFWSGPLRMTNQCFQGRYCRETCEQSRSCTN